mgnify:CR=1 FL=1|jgi:hypothetical protein
MYFNVSLSDRQFCPMRDGYSRCHGAECAAWRWKPELNPDWKPKSVSEFAAPTDYRREPQPYIDSKTEGYCGMANRPSFNP